nr:hypothetical protein [Tanacetum cinerariifolium]
MLKEFPLPVMKFPLPEYFPIASEEVFPLLREVVILYRTPCPIKEVLRIQQYLQNEHYTLWEVIEFGDSYEAPQKVLGTGSASESPAKKKGRTVVVTTKDMQKRKNDVKARTTLLWALLDEHQLRFNKYKTAHELWAAILKTFNGNKATKKTKKNQLKQQYGNFKAEGSEKLEKTFNRLHAIRNRSDLDTMSLDDLYNHLKVYEPEVQKKSKSNSQNMAFISLAKNSSGKEEVNTASILTASTHVSPASADVAAASISLDTVCAYIASQSNGSQIKYEELNQIDEDDIKEIDIKWNMALLSMRSKVECFNCHKMGHFARECMAPRSQDRGRREINKQGSKEEEQAPKDLMAIDGVGCLSQVEARVVEFKTQKIKFYEKIRGLEFDLKNKNIKIKNLLNELEQVKKEKEGIQCCSPSSAQVYSPPKKDVSWTGLPELADDTITDYSRPSFSIKSNSSDLQNSDSSVSKNGESSESIMCKPMIKFVKAADSPTNTTDKGPNSNSVSVIFKKYQYIDIQGRLNGCSRHMTGNISYLFYYEPYDGGYVSFGQGGGKITGKGIIKTGKLKFENDHTCVACLKGKQHNASCKTKLVNLMSKPLHTLHMDLFRPTSDETSGILRNFITEIENLKELKVKIIRCDNGGEFRNKEMNDFYSRKGIKRELSNARTPQQNGVAKQRNKTLIEAARTMLADAKLRVTFWAEAVNTVCYVQNRVLVNKSQNKTPYELFNGRTPAIGFLKPFGCHVM